MRVDSNTKGHRQWFYFSMQNEEKCKVKLHIYRFKKLYSLFQRGMRPYVKSRKSGNDWKPAGQYIYYHYQYKPNNYTTNKEPKSFVLSFTYTFQHENDEVLIAAGIPYTYTFLQKQLTTYKDQIERHQKLHIDISLLTKSMCGLDVQLITIEHRLSRIINKQKKKRIIIINTRTHSGQTSCSWVLDGVLMEISQSSHIQEWLLAQNVVLKIVPMLNPDGVFIGNYRTGIVGDDFNRKFNSGRRQYYPQIFALKKLVSISKKEGFVQLFLDLHGHSILKNVFIYGPYFKEFQKSKLRGLPECLFQNSKYFRLASCKFKAENENIETARVYFQLNEKILSFTCQNSLGLYYHEYRTHQMLSKDWQQFGKTLINSIKDLFYKEIPIHRDIETKKTNKTNKTINAKKQQRAEFQVKNESKINRINYKVRAANKVEKSGSKMFNGDISNKQYIASDKFEKIKLFGESINRQNTLLQDKVFDHPTSSMKDRSQREEKLDQHSVKFRRKSEIMKKGGETNLVNKIIGKFRRQRQERQERKNQEGLQPQENVFGRSSTFDHSYVIKNEIDNLNRTEERQLNEDYPLEVIHQNFSDEYCSINDLDSEDQNLPEQQKNYIFQYIKLNRNRGNPNSDEDEKKNDRLLDKSKEAQAKESKISKFREIRFKSIEQIYEKDVIDMKDTSKNIRKIKLEPHKFKDNNSKSLAYKYNEMLANHSEFQDPGMVTISQQKKLYERSVSKKKDPFILIQRKMKIQDFIEREQMN